MTPQLVAIIPAAGQSRRMGQPKLLLEWAGQSVLARVVTALKQGGISRCLVIVRPDDVALIRAAEAIGAEVIIPATAPPDMRASVEYGLRHIRDSASPPLAIDAWVLVPADHPTLDSLLIEQLIAAWSLAPHQIAVPVHQGRRGHPTIFPGSLVDEVFSLPPDQGLNQVLRSHPQRVLEINVSDPRVLDDLDTPEDWLRLQRQNLPEQRSDG